MAGPTSLSGWSPFRVRSERARERARGESPRSAYRGGRMPTRFGAGPVRGFSSGAETAPGDPALGLVFVLEAPG